MREEIQNEPIQQNVTQKKGIRKKKDLKQKLMQNCEEIFRSNTLWVVNNFEKNNALSHDIYERLLFFLESAMMILEILAKVGKMENYWVFLFLIIGMHNV